MDSKTYHDIAESATSSALEAIPMQDRVSRLEASLRRQVEDAINQKAIEGAVLILTEEEIRLIRSFRAFRQNMKRSGEVFKWQTVPALVSDEPLISTSDTTLIADPRDLHLAKT